MSYLFHEEFVFPNGKRVKNRVALAPMTDVQSNADGTINKREIRWLERCAAGGFGMIITCCTNVSKNGKGWIHEFEAYDDKFMPGMIDLQLAIRKHGALSIVQLFHAGSRSPASVIGEQPISSSPYVSGNQHKFLVKDNYGYDKPKEMTIDDIDQVVRDFADATERCYRAGFDGVELHGANSYLITQFMTPKTNWRTDEYGGSLENRARFMRRVIQESRKRVPKSFLVGIRINPVGISLRSGIDIDEMVQMSKWAIEDGVDFLHFSEINMFEPVDKYPELKLSPTQYFRREITNFPIITTGGVKKFEDGQKAIEHGADFFGMAMLAIGNTDWPIKSRTRDSSQIVMPPYTPEHLSNNSHISQLFIDYLDEFGLVKHEKKADYAFNKAFVFPNGVKVKNRVAVAPMTNVQSNADGTINQREINWLERCAEGGFGMIITCCTNVSKNGKGWIGEFEIYDDRFLHGLIDLQKAIRKHGALSVVQLFHAGSRSPISVINEQPISSSPYVSGNQHKYIVMEDYGYDKPKEMTIADIDQVVRDFADATERCYRAGFDGVELHGANSYLITQFMTHKTNWRTNEYGGSLENRARFMRRVIQESRKRVPKKFLVGLRINPIGISLRSGIDVDEMVQMSKWAIEDGIDFLHFSEINVFEPVEKYPELNLPPIAYFRREIKDFPIMITGGVKTFEDGQKAIELGADFFGMAMIAIGNTDWPQKSKSADSSRIIMPPYTTDHLEDNLHISQPFINYLQDFGLIKQCITRL